MKDTRNEILSDRLLDIDEDLLQAAYAIDDAKKLKSYAKEHVAERKSKARILPALRKVSLVAACLILAVGILLSAPFILNPNDIIDPPDTETDPPLVDTENIYTIKSIDTIDTIDMLNYYSALKVLIDPPKISQVRAENDLIPLSTSTTRDSASEEIFSTFQTGDFFSVSMGTFFQIKVTDENGFLASKVGTGTVDVAITNNDLNPMITLKNGERYYSCFWNSGDTDRITFSTHKYAVDFCIVKNMDQNNYTLTVTFDENGQVTEFRCSWFNEPEGLSPDGSVTVASKTNVFRGNTNFTISELENFFSSEKQMKLEKKDTN